MFIQYCVFNMMKIFLVTPWNDGKSSWLCGIKILPPFLFIDSELYIPRPIIHRHRTDKISKEEIADGQTA